MLGQVDIIGIGGNIFPILLHFKGIEYKTAE